MFRRILLDVETMIIYCEMITGLVFVYNNFTTPEQLSVINKYKELTDFAYDIYLTDF